MHNIIVKWFCLIVSKMNVFNFKTTNTKLHEPLITCSTEIYQCKIGLTWIIPGWSLVLFPGHGVPSCIIHPSSGIFCAFATSPLIRILNSSYSLCTTEGVTSIRLIWAGEKGQPTTFQVLNPYLHSSTIFDK